ncbi:toll/interleukin-1 receptor domain-containing protein [Sphingopyxis sp. KK2]|uniref:toll/interleukin-1 receptor domain-containing protein n=1 Tax=Sphingopyxis sp. KK2 TaxID=1855727 RepID=UPI00097E7405|nr:toll/interleukin-1 receptor domain-containing protein [Sphingopyxis sp. KK2]
MSNNADDALPPKVFISYRWTSPAHEEWVLRIATSLRKDGVNVILDKWYLQEGQDTLAFMEQMVSDPTMGKVLLICDREYVDRANSRVGGVGTEAQIVSASVYEKTDQNKVAAIVTELNIDGKPYLPIYMSTRLYFDMSSENSESVNYEKLLRWIFGKPFHALPPIGEQPKFLDSIHTIGTTFARLDHDVLHFFGEDALILNFTNLCEGYIEAIL